MPNHCYNKVSIVGSKDSLEKIKKKLIKKGGGHTNYFSFHKIVPQPNTLKDEEWYDWCVSNWGTKWDSYDGDIKSPEIKEGFSNSYKFITDRTGTSTLTYSFNTAWSPASKVISALTSLFPDVVVTYYYLEEGMDFAGKEVFKDGEIVDGRELKVASVRKTIYLEPDPMKLVKSVKKYLK